MSWEGHDSSSEEEDDNELTGEDPMVGSFLRARSSNADSDEDDGGDSDDGADANDSSTIGFRGDRLLLCNDPLF
jgi:hypothetical protein